jgi:prefoldin subunit 5
MPSYNTQYDGSMKSASVPEASKMQTQVSTQMQIQEKLISELASMIDRLEYNLASITRQLPNAIAVDDKEEVLVPLASNIRTNNGFLIGNIKRIETLINTLEL